MVMNMAGDVETVYASKLNKLLDLFNEGILPAVVKELVKDWNKKLETDSLYTTDRKAIDDLLEDGLNREKQEKLRVNKNVWQSN